jgi:hypothetical protein
MAGGDDLAADLDQRDHPGLESPIRSELGGIPGSPMAEPEVLAHGNVGGAQAVDQHVLDELVGPLLGDALVEADHNQLLHAEPADQLDLGLEPGQQFRCRLRPDHAERVGLEGQHRVVAGDHLAVTEMDAVELPHGDPARTGLGLAELGHAHRRRSLTQAIR